MEGLAHILPARPFGRPAVKLSGYAPQHSCAIEPLKRLLLWAFAKNGGDRCVMSIPVMVRLLGAYYSCEVCPRTVVYALKRLVLGGFISRQSQWFVREGVVIPRRSVTRPKGRLMREQLDRGMRGLKLLALTWQPNGEKIAQKIASGYVSLLADVLPHPLK